MSWPPTGGTEVVRRHEMRIVVECSIGVEPAELSAAVAGVLDGVLTDWHAMPLLRGRDTIWMISGQTAERVGTAEYAKVAHTLVQRVIERPVMLRAEADMPVRPRGDADDGGLSSPTDLAECPPGSEVLLWSLGAVRAAEAWALPVPPGGAARGAGVVIGHPDTGYTLHPNLAPALDLTRDRDILDDDDDALDPLPGVEASPWLVSFPGHGTKTASVIVGREAGGIGGVAPDAALVPIRTALSVIQLFDSDVARAVEYARTIGCHVITLSLGGKGFFGLEQAIQDAVDAGIIVLAAAGNQVGIVVAPASYPNCLAVAATGVDDQPWPASSRGSMVDVSAPGWCVWVAGFRWEDEGPAFAVVPETGTSYAVAQVAGVAALWLGRHGPAAVRERYGPRVQAAFLHLLRTVSRVPVGWDATQWGAGVVDAAAMLSAPLPEISDLGDDGAPGDPPASAYVRLGGLVNLHGAEFHGAMARRMGIDGEDLHRTVTRFEGELAFHLLEEPAFRAYLLGSGSADAAAREAHASSSPEFAVVFLGGGAAV
jgi:hypothetical protein